MHLSFYDNWEAAYFVKRLNRFVMKLRKDGELVDAYIPNTGRMSEFLFKDQIFYITRVYNSKYKYRVISTKYRDSLVFLDTTRINDIFHKLLENNLVDKFPTPLQISREVSFGRSRFDFLLKMPEGISALVELKSCTLCHNSIAMFPDAPTSRGRKHIRELERLAKAGKYHSNIIFLITNRNARKFYPNFHTDYEYGQMFLKSKNVQYHAYSIAMKDPVTIDLSSIKNVKIDFEKTARNCVNKGSYLLILENEEDCIKSVGKLGELSFSKGYYVYIGSGMNSLDKRVKRHRLKRKKLHWHIDYITPGIMQIRKAILIRSIDRMESQLAGKVLDICNGCIDNFGATDTDDVSHLLYFKENPLFLRKFLNVILDHQFR